MKYYRSDLWMVFSSSSTILLLLILSSVITNTLSLTFNISGYEQCICNLVFSGHNHISTNDFVQHILVSNPGIMSWRTYDAPPLMTTITKNFSYLPVHVPHDLKEVCSINLLITLSGDCSGQDMLMTFGSRLYNANNALYLIHANHSGSGCSNNPEEISDQFYGRIDVNPVLIQLTPDNYNVQTAVLYCISCTNADHIIVQLPVPHQNLLEVADYITYVVNSYFVPIVAGFSDVSTAISTYRQKQQCGFLYKMTPWTNSLRIGCEPEHLLIENAAIQLNYSVQYGNTNFVVPVSWNIPRRFHAVIAVVGIGDWRRFSNHISPDNLIQNVLMGQNTFEFLYCAKSEKREGLSFFFWIAPFDKTS